MNAESPVFPLAEFLNAEPRRFGNWIRERPLWLLLICLIAVVGGAGIYGAVMGSWNNGLQAVYAGIKLPLVLLLTTLGNGLLNGMLAPLLGLNVTFRQSLLIVLATFAVTATILGALAPVALFFIWNTPPLRVSTLSSAPEYAFLQLLLTVFMAVAGIVGNLKLVPMLTQWAQSVSIARRVLLAWLAVNLFLGSQISWMLRPFIWDPDGPVRFWGGQYLRGSFFETVFEAARRLIFP